MEILFLFRLTALILFIKNLSKIEYFANNLIYNYNFCVFYKFYNKLFRYKFLPKSRVHNKYKKFYISKVNLATAKTINDNKKFLLTVSKFIDYKINSCNTKFRSYKNTISIDWLSKKIVDEFLQSYVTDIFSKFKKVNLKYNITEYEKKVFKYLVAKHLLQELLNKIYFLKLTDKIIKINFNSKKINYKPNNKTFFDAAIYSVYNYNPHANQLIKSPDIKKHFIGLFSTLFALEFKINAIICYLKSIFI